MVDFISEVQEELRKDDYNRWLRKYGPYLAGLIVLIVAGTGYYQWDLYQKQVTSEKFSYDFIEIVDSVDGDKDQAISGFTNLSKTAPSGYAGISLLRAAELQLESGNKEDAVKLLDEAAASLPKKRHIQLAQLKAAYIVSGLGNFEDVKRRLEPLAVKDEPYQYLARELLAHAATQTGDLQTARMQLSYIENSPGAPETIANRAKQTLMLMGVEAFEASEELTAPIVPAENVIEEGAEKPVETETDE